ncbi:MAG: SDR family NAD(P)-dependent oxidoreductase [bacterium]|nr:SDR family NAD(P)-dependent oxidoreductase [bacterium]MDZ4231176.1 SDR family NAD(P)-dependent oxidoreductase [Patescibacteria group bacterium]
MEQTPLKDLIDLSSKTAIVTGGAVGIGLGIVARLAEAGAKVAVADIDGEGATKASEKLNESGWQTMAVEVDVSDKEAVEEMVRKVEDTLGKVDILVNNAGIYPSIPVMSMSEEDFERVIDINLKGVYLCTKAVANRMIERKSGGRIINITSIDALHPSSVGLAHYDASKHGVWGFTKNIALELAPHKIWVNAIAPGAIATPGVAALQGGMKAPKGVDMNKFLEGFLAKIPMGRMGEPDDIGRAALFFASDLSSYVTGAQLVVDGGVLLS